MVTVTATVKVSDDIDPSPSVVLTSVVSSEPDAGLDLKDKPNDIQDADIGTDDREFSLRAERSEEGPGRVYTITYTATDASGNSSDASATVTVRHDKGKGKKQARLALPGTYALLQNAPNPFNAVTTIPYVLPQTSLVRLAVYDLRGSLVRVLVDGLKEAGQYQSTWDGRDKEGQNVSSGVYIARLEAREGGTQVTFSQARRITLLR